MGSESTRCGDGSEDLRAMPEIPLSDLMAYFEAVRLVTRRYLDRFTGNDLPRAYYHRGRNRSGTWLLGHVLAGDDQHMGQVAMIRDMMRELDA